jgi:hypothetical protein
MYHCLCIILEERESFQLWFSFITIVLGCVVSVAHQGIDKNLCKKQS